MAWPTRCRCRVGAFAGKGSAWFDRQHLKDTFIAALRVFPLAAGKLPSIEGGFWRKDNSGELEQCHLRVRIQPPDALGVLLVQVDLATVAHHNPDQDRQQSMTARFLTEYAALDAVAYELEQVLDGTREAAV